MLKRIAVIILCLALLVGVVQAEEKYPTSWDLTLIYESAEDWYADFERAMELVPGEERYRGRLHTPEGIYEAFDLGDQSELHNLCRRLYFYCGLGLERCPSDPVYSDMIAKAATLDSAVSQATAYIDAEIYSLSMEEREALFADPLLAGWSYYFKDYLNPHKQPLSEETLVALSKIAPSKGYGERISDILDASDIPFPTITMPDGAEVELTDLQYRQITKSDSYSREFKYEAAEIHSRRVESFENTFAALLEMAVQEYWADAQIEQYDSCLQYALESEDVDPAIYDMLVEAAHRGITDYQRYLNLHKQALGLEKQYSFDMNQTVSEYSVSNIPYDEAVDSVREALRVLGDEYIADYDSLMTSPVNDVYPAEGKPTGAFSWSMDKELPIYAMFNYIGVEEDVSTIAHELGHSIYGLRSMRNQPGVYATPTIFTHEVASTTNELLYYTYKMENAVSDDEHLFYLERLLDMFSSAFFTQVRYAEFEDWLYKTVEAGGSLNGAELTEKYKELLKLYRGEAVETFDFSGYSWMTIPHLYYNYYVYQYASSASYAAAICQRIISGAEGAVDAYLEFLSLGGSASPAELLKVAGVDPLQEESYQLALDFFSNLVDEYEVLINK